MPDKNPELVKKKRINIRDPEEVALWTETLNIYVADLVKAVDEVGDEAEKVLLFLRQHGTPGSRAK
jgi:hypothetical protein